MQKLLNVIVFVRDSFAGMMLATVATNNDVFLVVGFYDSVDACDFAALDALKLDVVVVDTDLFDSNPSLAERLAALAPIVELVDAACASCSRRAPAGVRGGALRRRSAATPCYNARQKDAGLCWNIVSRWCSPATLAEAIVATANRQRFTDPHAIDDEVAAIGLSRREWQVARAIADGKTDAEIADLLYRSIYTIKSQVKAVIGKFDCHHRSEVQARINGFKKAAGGRAGSSDKRTS